MSIPAEANSMQDIVSQILRGARSLLLAAAPALLLAGPALADLQDTIVVKLAAPAGIETDPTPFEFTQAAPLASGVVAANLGGSGAISDFMLDFESITFAGDAVLIRVGAGAESGLNPGFGDGARYEISGLAVPGFIITGFTVSAFDGYADSGATGLDDGLLPSSLVSINATFDTLSLTLDNNLSFRDRGLGGSNNFAEFRIELLTQPIPEPASVALMLAGLLAVAVRVRALAGRRA
jgi:hypothetical protein